MKKLVLFAAIVAAVSFSACGGKQEAPQTEEQVAETTETVIEEAPVVADSTVVVDSTAVQAAQ